MTHLTRLRCNKLMRNAEGPSSQFRVTPNAALSNHLHVVMPMDYRLAALQSQCNPNDGANRISHKSTEDVHFYLNLKKHQTNHLHEKHCLYLLELSRRFAVDRDKAE